MADLPRVCSHCGDLWDDDNPHTHGIPVRDDCERCAGYGRLDPLHGGPCHEAFNPAYCIPCPVCATPNPASS